MSFVKWIYLDNVFLISVVWKNGWIEVCCVNIMFENVLIVVLLDEVIKNYWFGVVCLMRVW